MIWRSVTTGNFVGFDAWVDKNDGALEIATNLGDLQLPLADVGYEDQIHDAGGLERRITVFRLPDGPLARETSFKRTVALDADGDNPVWICVTTEDGFQAWTSPVYLFR